jgi:hypothetical protein
MRGAAQKGKRLLAEVQSEMIIPNDPRGHELKRPMAELQRVIRDGFQALKANFDETVAAKQPGWEERAQGYRSWLVRDIQKVRDAVATMLPGNPDRAAQLGSLAKTGESLLATMPASAGPPVVELNPEQLIDDEVTEVESTMPLDDNDIMLDDDEATRANVTVPQANIDTLKAKFLSAFSDESMGGTAGNVWANESPGGPHKAILTVTGLVDQKTGRIIDVGVYQDLKHYQDRIESGEANLFAIQVDADYVIDCALGRNPQGSPYFLVPEDTRHPALSPAARRELQTVVAWANAHPRELVIMEPAPTLGRQ